MTIEDRRTLLADSFEQFVVDDSNAEAYEACVAFSDSNCTDGALIICGPHNSGKSHLVKAILGKIKDENPQIETDCFVGEDFASRVIWEYGRRKLDDDVTNFISSCLKNQVFVIDNIDFIIGRTSSEKALLNLISMSSQTNTRFIFTVQNEEDLHKVSSSRLHEILLGIQKVTLGEQCLALRKKWMTQILSNIHFEVQISIANRIAEETKSIQECILSLFYYEACLKENKLFVWNEFVQWLKRN